MNSWGIFGWLLTALGAASGPAASSPSTAASHNQRIIEILVTGPEGARNRMVAAIQPIVATAPDLRWVTQESLPAGETLPPSTEEGAAHIWIDVSNLTQVRVYLPEKANPGPAVRTLESEDVDPIACEAVAQIVKASVLALRETPGEAVPPGVVEPASISSRPGPDVHDGLYLRAQSGFGYLRTSESYGAGSDVFQGVGATLQAAVGVSIVGHLVLHGEVAMTAVRNAEWTSNQGPVLGNGPYESGRDLTLLGVGPGVTYYLPSNFYVSGSFLVSKLWFLDANTDRPPPDTHWGIGGSVAIGKEWWLSRSWGMGIAAQFNDAVMAHPLVIQPTKSPQSISPAVNVANFALLMSATYN